MQLTARQHEIMEIVKQHEPIIGDQIAEMIGVSRPTIRSDLAVLVMLGMLDAKPKVGYFLGTQMTTASRDPQALHEKRVKDVVSRPVIVKESTTIQDAVITMFLEDVGNLVVAGENGELAGVVSRKDLLKLAWAMPLPADAGQHGDDAAAQGRRPASPEDPVLDAAAKMIHHQVDSLPVIEESRSNRRFDQHGDDNPAAVGAGGHRSFSA